MSTIPKKFGFIRTTLALWAADLFPGRAGVVTDAPVGSSTSETWGWHDGAGWKFAARRGGDEVFTAVNIDKPAGNQRILRFRSGGLNRWTLLCAGDAESGGNVGSDLALFAFNDAGATIDIPLFVSRIAGGNFAINRPVVTSGTVKAYSGIGFHNVTPPTVRPTVNAACTDLATCVALTNQLRTHLIACGLVQ